MYQTSIPEGFASAQALALEGLSPMKSSPSSTWPYLRIKPNEKYPSSVNPHLVWIPEYDEWSEEMATSHLRVPCIGLSFSDNKLLCQVNLQYLTLVILQYNLLSYPLRDLRHAPEDKGGDTSGHDPLPTSIMAFNAPDAAFVGTLLSHLILGKTRTSSSRCNASEVENRSLYHCLWTLC
jgi:hypothetical protein